MYPLPTSQVAFDASACEQQFAQLRRDGWALFPRAVSADLVGAALDAIRADRAANHDPARQVEYEDLSYCPDLRDKPPIEALLTHSSARAILDHALGWEQLGRSHGQIAIRQAHNTDKPYAPVPHIDGIGTGTNGLAVGGPIASFTALLGIFLTKVDREFAGNLAVWPGSHHLLEAHFRSRGPEAMLEGMPRAALGDPVQLQAEPGDVVLCHYQLAHAAAVNVSPNDRIAIYFRVWFKDIDNRRFELLSNIWNGWRI